MTKPIIASKRDDPTARRFHIGRSLIPRFFLDIDPNNPGITTIRPVVDPSVSLGWIDLNELSASIIREEQFDEPHLPAYGMTLLHEGIGEAFTPEEWAENGWSEPDYALHFVDEYAVVSGGQMTTTTHAESVLELADSLRWILDPEGDRDCVLLIDWGDSE